MSCREGKKGSKEECQERENNLHRIPIAVSQTERQKLELMLLSRNESIN